MPYRTILILFAALLAASCEKSNTTSSRDQLIEEIKQVEAQFKADVKKLGVGAAFHSYADTSVAMIRGNDSLITGRMGVKAYYSRPVYDRAQVEWGPEFIDVSQSGDLAYSYGRYHWILVDSAGQQSEFRGRYLTIWKKQADGSWKYVWD
jgi:ketosteroid isomerase-like protein